MPTRKQRRRALKERRHEYETVWVDEEGNELEAPPEEARAETKQRRDDGNAKPKAKAQPQRGGRPVRVPPEPSWRRAIRRSVIWIVILGALLVYFESRAKNHPSLLGYVPVVAAYVVLFPVMTYFIDRSVYRRYLAKQQKADAAKRR